MIALRFRTLQRVAALAALLAFAVLPHVHLRGHDWIASAAAGGHGAASTVEPGAGLAGSGQHVACPLCLSLAQVASALVYSAAVPLRVLAPSRPLAPAPASLLRDAPGLASCAPRAPLSVLRSRVG